MKARFFTVGEVFTNIKKKKVKNNPEVLHWNWTCWLCSGKYEFMACVYALLTHTDIELVIDVYVCAYTHVCTYTDFFSATSTERAKKECTQVTMSTLRSQILMSKCYSPLEGIRALGPFRARLQKIWDDLGTSHPRKKMLKIWWRHVRRPQGPAWRASC